MKPSPSQIAAAKDAGGKALAFGKKLVSSKWFWYAVIAIVLILLVRKYWRVIKGKFTPLKGDFSSGLSEMRKSYVDELVEKLGASISPKATSFWSFNWASKDREDTLWTVYGLNDSELKYLIKEYNSRFGNISEDLEGAWLPATNADEKLLSRIFNMGV